MNIAKTDAPSSSKAETESIQQLGFTQDQEDRFLEAFTLFDTDGNGLISVTEIIKVIRALGQTPTVCDETDIVAQFTQEQCNDLDFRAFVKLISTRLKDVNEEDELRESFRRFDKEETGLISTRFLRKALLTTGEPLTEEEVDEWLNDARPFIEKGNIKYEDFATYMLSR